MNIDFSNVFNDIPQLECSLEIIVDVYRQAEWDDDVYQSYITYIRECTVAEESLRGVLNHLECIMHELRSITSGNTVNDELEQIFQECDNIKV